MRKQLFTVIVLFLLVTGVATTIAQDTSYSEAPALADLVASGDLPPVAERLPANPLVLEPVEEIGQYGGIWRSFDMSGDFMNHTWLTLNEAWLKYERDATGFRLNILENYEWNDDATEVTVYFREGMRWSDGELVTVDDYIWFWEEMALNENVPIRPPEGTIAGNGEPMQLEKIDDYTLKVILAAPDPLFLEFQSRNRHFNARHITPSHYMEQFHPDFSDEYEDGNALVDRFNAPFQYVDMPTLNAWRPVEFVSGQRAVLERNPYYWKVDPAGNQLPYIDRLEVEIGQSGTGINLGELMVLKSIAGELDMQVRQYEVPDIPVLIENQEAGGYRVILWREGNVAGPRLNFQYGYLEDDIVDLFYCQDFRIALSLGIDRERVNDVTALGLGEIRQFAMLPYEPEFQTEEGNAFYEEWRDSYVDLNTDEASALLDGIGIVDRDGDGWRDRHEQRLDVNCQPTGEANPNADQPLELVIDIIHGPLTAERVELIRDDWEAIGVKAIVNQLDSAVFAERERNRESMIIGWVGGVTGGMISSPGGWAPIRGFPGGLAGSTVGLWYQTGGEEGVPPREGSELVTLTELYDAARQEVDPQVRSDLILEAYRVHLETGPWAIGVVGDFPSPVVVNENMRNVPDFGIVGGWGHAFPGSANPEQFFYSQ